MIVPLTNARSVIAVATVRGYECSAQTDGKIPPTALTQRHTNENMYE
jgi:hypothetical protein